MEFSETFSMASRKLPIGYDTSISSNSFLGSDGLGFYSTVQASSDSFTSTSKQEIMSR